MADADAGVSQIANIRKMNRLRAQARARLYGRNTLVVFCATFSSSYAYTRLARVDEPADLPQVPYGSLRESVNAPVARF
jgi:hypothetical protein